jgi:hypothetical protein
MQFLKANTQVIVTVGPFVDVGDGFTPQTDITLAGDEAELIKHGSTSVVSISGATWAAVTSCRGYYSLTLTTSHTDTEGMLVVIVQDDSDCLPVKQEYMVLSEAAYDSMFVAKDTGFMDVNVKAISEDTAAADRLELACDAYTTQRGLSGTALPNVAANGAGGLPISIAGGLDLDAMNTNINDIETDTADMQPKLGTPAASLAADIAAVKTEADKIALADAGVGVAGSVIEEVENRATPAQVQAELVTYDGPTDAEMIARTLPTASYFDPAADTVANVTTVASVTALAANSVDASALATDAVDEIVDGVWDEALSGHTTGGTAGKALQNAAAFIVTDGTCQATGQTSTNIRLAAGESATNEIYTNDEIVITGGTGAGESALITAYDGTNKDCTVSPALVVTCDGTSTYEIVPAHAHAENLGVDAVDTTSVATGAIDADALATDAVNEIRDSILSDATTFPGASITEVRLAELAAANMPADLDAVLLDTGTTIPGTITTLQSDTDDIQTRLPAALVGGAMDSDVSAMQTDAISAAAMSAGAAQKVRDEILPTQNVAFNNMEFLFVDSTDHVTPVTGAGTMAVTRSIDGGAFGAGTGTGPAEVGNGIYQYDASAADMNGGIITFRFTATTTFVTVITGGGV